LKRDFEKQWSESFTDISVFLGRAFLVLLVLLGLSVDNVLSQDVHLSPSPLAEALETIRTDLGVDLVYTDELVEGRRHTCSYRGSFPLIALDCILRENGLKAKRFSSSQIVIFKPKAKLVPENKTYSGLILDSELQTPIAGVHVFIPKLSYGAITGPDGRFVLDVNQENSPKVEVSHVGYKKKVLILNDKAQIKLEPSSFAGVEVVVDAMPKKDKEDPFLIASSETDLISDGRFDNTAFSSEGFVFQPVQWLPGIRRTGEVGGNLLVRGGLPDQNQFLLDGAPVYQPWHAQGLVSILQPSSLESLPY